MILIKKTECPVSERGRASTTPIVAVRGNGQISLNNAAIKEINPNKDAKYILVAMDGRKMTLQLLSKVPAKMNEADLFKIGYGKKSGGAFSSFTSVFQHSEVAYDYKKSGNQSFDAAVDAKKGTVTFELPKGSLTPKPTVKRTHKSKANGAVPAEAKATPQTTTNPAELLDLDTM